MKMAECCGVLLLVLTLFISHPYGFTITQKREDEASLRREYPLEEFLWTGSGDGPNVVPGAGPEESVAWVTTTVFRTTTRVLAPPASVSLVRPSQACPQPSACSSLQPSVTWDELSTPQFTISLEPSETSFTSSRGSSVLLAATPTLSTSLVLSTVMPAPPDRAPNFPDTPEKRFWIVTIVEEQQGESQQPNTPVLEVGLAKLYATAFKRQQERHLGIVNATNNKLNRALGMESRRRRGVDDVLVRVHNVSEGSPRRMQLVYSVHVSGRPVLARAAVHDMRLVSDAEVAFELGRAVVTKAEPYLKENEAARTETFTASPWVLAAGALSAVLLLCLVLCLLGLATTRHKRARRIAGQRTSHAGATNLSYEPDEPRRRSDDRSVSAGSAAKILAPEDWVDSESLDDELPPPSADQAAAAVSAAVSAARSGAISPSSYLSMPSVRKFPRGGNIPEPLSQILQQQGGGERGRLSMRNLDLYPDETAFEPAPPPGVPPPPARPSPPMGFPTTRHGSLDGEDPGVVGPCVYQYARGAGPARRRFQELLDDAFSLFGGGSEEELQRRTPTPPRPPSPRVDSRVHSAAQARVSEPESPPVRPKTSEPRRAAMQPRRGRPPLPDAPRAGSAGPRGAWETPGEPSSGMRPLSAGPFHRPRLPESRPPRVAAERILVDTHLPASDPAVPLISAIKDELQKFQACSACTTPLPGCPTHQQQK